MAWEFLFGSVESLINLIDSLGYIGIFLLMTLESSFIPFPSEVVLIPAGVLIAQGKMIASLAFLAAVLGSLLGALINYYLAFYLGRSAVKSIVSKYGRFILINEKSLVKSEKYFERRGELTTFIGRLIPIIRQLISLPAGFARMNLYRFCLFTILGSAAWSIFLLYVGYLIGYNLTRIEETITYFSTISQITLLIIIVLGAFYVIRKATKR